MSLVQNSFLQLPLQKAIKLYNDEIIPRLSKKNKSIAISVAVAMTLVYLIKDRILTPPRKLRHIPYVSHLTIIKSMIRGESYWDRIHRVNLAEVDRPDSKGLILEPGPFGWEVQVSNPEDAKRIFMKHDLFPKNGSTDAIRSTLLGKFAGGPNIVTLNGHQWKSQRMVANPAFRRSMPVKLFGKLTQDMFEIMETMGDVVDVSDLMERWTLDAIGKAGFGFDFNAIPNRNSEWVTRYNRINTGMADPKFFIFPKLDKEFLWMFPERGLLHKELVIFKEMLQDVIKNKKLAIENNIKNNALEENEKDLLELMLESEKEGNGVLSEEELMSNIALFFLAGHDTTANALSFAIHYLAENQDIQQRARNEAIAILGDEPNDVLPTIEDTKKMTYINQIMKETLRINGPAVKTLVRKASEDTELSGTFIPKGTRLSVNIFTIHHSEKVWINPSQFDPERFSENGEGMAWAPFGNGARQCIGMNFSLNEQRVMLSMLLRKFIWSTPDNSPHKNKLITTGFGVVGPVELDIKFCKRY